MKRHSHFLSALPPWIIMGLALALTAILGVVDYRTGRDLTIGPFYLVPICWAGWLVGRRAGLTLALASTIAWLIGDLKMAYPYAYPAIPYWNALMVLLLYMVVVFLLSAFQTAHYRLEDTVQLRTAALQAEIAKRQRLEIAKLQAERLAMVGTMAAQVAHEVRNPLGSIALNLDLINKEIDRLAGTSHHQPEEGRLLVNEVRAEVHRIHHVIEDYLQFARLPKLQRHSLALNEFLEQKLAFMNSTFTDDGVELRTEFDPTLAPVKADGEQLWQAVLNLIRNSLEAMPDGGALTVRTGRENGQVALQIADTGKGMTEAETRQVFMPFFSTKAEGTGLGLTLVQQIVIEHGGHIECASARGQGSTFTIYLPLPEAA